MERLKRKADDYLESWKRNPEKLPLIVKGARQVGKTEAIRHFAEKHYSHIIEINFALERKYKSIFDDGFKVDTIVRNITLLDVDAVFSPGDTLLFFDEMQDCINCASSLKAFSQDGRYDVICSGSMMGVNYNEIESNSVGYKEDYIMYSLDFEEFLWAKGYSGEQIDGYYEKMLSLTPLGSVEFDVMMESFREYIITGGMPAVVFSFIRQKNYSGILKMQRQLLLDYEEDITKYAVGFDKGRILNVYRKIPVFLGKDNKKFQISKVASGARSREYSGSVEWLNDAGVVNICYCMSYPELPLKGNYDPDNYKLYFCDTGLMTASLDDEAQTDLRENKNFNTYKGALYENIVGEMLVKQGYSLFFFKNEKATLEMDFFVRSTDSLIPVEVKANNNTSSSLKKIISSDSYPDVQYGIKLANANIGSNDMFFTFPYFMTFLLKRFLKEQKKKPNEFC